jgi:hypothetical protein
MQMSPAATLRSLTAAAGLAGYPGPGVPKDRMPRQAVAEPYPIALATLRLSSPERRSLPERRSAPWSFELWLERRSKPERRSRPERRS